jgi:hypothetical protein
LEWAFKIISSGGRMNLGFWNNYTYFKKNGIFDSRKYQLGDNLGAPAIKLRKVLQDLGISCMTIDMKPLEQFDKVIFIDYPEKKERELWILKSLGKPLILFIAECEGINPHLYDPSRHAIFDEVFTYKDDLVDGERYKKFFLPNEFAFSEEAIMKANPESRKFITLIGSKKGSNDPRELYSERERAIDYFAQHHSEDFRFYGFGWDEYRFHGSKFFRALNRIKPLVKALGTIPQNYGGKVDKKRDVLMQYNFAICYENIYGVNGYITEKIFDCFFAGCIPVYLGAPNIGDFVPERCYIDRRHFKTHEDLDRYLISLDGKAIVKMKENIVEFLGSRNGRRFSSEYFIDLIIRLVA